MIPPDPASPAQPTLPLAAPSAADARPAVTRESLLAGLNPPQAEAVQAGEGPTLVLAGPGSGKTRVLTNRVAWLIGVLGVPPWRILAVTFTNKAAREMKSRVERLVGPEAVEQLTIGTFHSTCAGLLRREATGASEYLDFDSRFVIFDTDDQLRVVKRALAELGIDEKQYRPRAILGAISTAKNDMILPEDYQPPSYWHEVAGRVYGRYQTVLRTSNALDFDDLLFETARLLRVAPEIRDRYRERYLHILVDEFQDTNSAQYALVTGIASAEDRSAPRNLFVVGDEDQSIYRWRGADYRNIERFRTDFPDARSILLEQNYRSTQTILDAASAVIDRNKQRTPKELWTEAKGGEKITLFEAHDEGEEAAYVIRRIGAHIASGTPPGDIAVMYRTNAQSRAVEDALVRRGIAYHIVGGTRFYERREVRDVLAYLRLAHNPSDEISLQRVINVPPRGIGKTTWSTLLKLATLRGETMWETIEHTALGLLDPEESSQFGTRGLKALSRVHEVISALVASRDELTPGPLVDVALDATGYAAWLRDGTDEGEERWENILELRSVAADYDSLQPREGLTALLENVALVADVDALEEESERVTLLTLHSAKGLEYGIVFIIGLEEDTLPHKRAIDDPDELEEERRLFYVGITRAERRLYLLRAYRRMLFGGYEPRRRSRFLEDLPPHLLDGELRGDPVKRATTWEQSRRPTRSSARAQTSKPVKSLPVKSHRAAVERHLRAEARAREAGEISPAEHIETGFRPGDKVKHEVFGKGVVVSAKPSGDDEEVTVAFIDKGVKTLLQRLAKLEKIGA